MTKRSFEADVNNKTNIGSDIYVTVSDFQNKTLIQVRKYTPSGVRTAEGVPMYRYEMLALMEHFMNLTLGPPTILWTIRNTQVNGGSATNKK